MNHKSALRRELSTLPLPARSRNLYPLFHHVAYQYAERHGVDRHQAVGLVFDLVAEALDTKKENQYLDRLIEFHFQACTLATRLQELAEATG